MNESQNESEDENECKNENENFVLEYKLIWLVLVKRVIFDIKQQISVYFWNRCTRELNFILLIVGIAIMKKQILNKFIRMKPIKFSCLKKKCAKGSKINIYIKNLISLFLQSILLNRLEGEYKILCTGHSLFLL